NLDDGKWYPLPGCQMIVLRHMSANGEMGIRPIDVLRASLDFDAQTKELSLDQLDGVNQGVILSVPSSPLDKSRRDNLVDSFLEAYERSGRRVVILEGGLTATTFAQSPIDVKLLDVERITRNRVATVYNIPPHLLGDYTDTLAVLMESTNPSQGRLRGKTDEALVVEGKDEFYVKAAQYGRLYVPFDENGHPLSERVARHVTGVAQLAISLGEIGEGNLTLSGVPSYSEMVGDIGPYLVPKA
ncbi:MAG: phage portal protein, partial [Oscillospiraceae bacterium]